MKVNDDLKKVMLWAARIGFVLGLICHLLPSKYHHLCQFVVKLLTGGL